MDTFTLRLAFEREAHAIAAMSREYIEYGLGWRYQPARVLRAMRQRETTVLAACEGVRLTGFAVMEFGEQRAHLVLMAVHPAQRRRGIGRAMLAWLTESALTTGIESVHLELRAGNEAGRRFYRALGFSETIRIPGYYGGAEAALRMLRLLRCGEPVAEGWRPPAHWR